MTAKRGWVPDRQTLEDRRDFWTGYQPGFRTTAAVPGTPEFFAEVECDRYRREPDIEEMARFEAWRGRDVLEAGCGIATDGVRFARAGARYTGVDFSPTAIELARERLARDGHEARLVLGSVTELPFEDASFDLVYSNGVIHHLPETEAVVREFHRVLRPGGHAIVMVYHRDSLNYRFTILTVRRTLAALLLVPGARAGVARLTGERPDVLHAHAELLRTHGMRYLLDRQMFLNYNTDGPGNPLSKVYGRADAARLFRDFATVTSRVRYLNLRTYPGGDRVAASRFARRAERRWGWHLWLEAEKAR
jgi:SAM-dependent methyltransferase